LATTVFHRRLIAAKMNSVHSSIAASQGHRSLARASQSQLEIGLRLFCDEIAALAHRSRNWKLSFSS
jgi:hypothetical protein